MKQPHQPRRSIAVVVDDDAAQRFLSGTLFEEADFEVAECSTADEAWELIQSRRDDVQLLFTDIYLPGSMDGMRGGTLVVRGSAGVRFGDRMRRGTALVFGDAGDFLASRLVAGTIALAGRAGAHVGYGMRRGSLVFAGPAPTVAACLAMSSADPPPMPMTTAPGCARTSAAAASTVSIVGSPGGATCTTCGSVPRAPVTRAR